MRVALRDASFYGSARFALSLGQPRYVPVYHAIKPDDPNYSACGRLILPESEIEHYATSGRCGRPGCRQAWAVATNQKESM